ncbi:SatD family protein [Eudoraea sp.]|uniref:SatD family protein n=1 Tax=Eudoraea sp. TaxID=1979955 RepID=UPI003C745C91
MIAVLTGDIINSAGYKTVDWLPVLKNFFLKLGDTPEVWEIYRGDEFQIRIAAEKALEMAIQIKALIKTTKNLDVRIGIGLGDEDFRGAGVSESNGSAYQRSGRTLSLLKERKINLAIATGDPELDDTLNLMLKLGLDFMDSWSVVSAEIILMALVNPRASQKEVAEQFQIQQSAVSQRYKRARLDLVKELLNYYDKNYKNPRS